RGEGRAGADHGGRGADGAAADGVGTGMVRLAAGSSRLLAPTPALPRARGREFAAPPFAPSPAGGGGPGWGGLEHRAPKARTADAVALSPSWRSHIEGEAGQSCRRGQWGRPPVGRGWHGRSISVAPIRRR